MKVSVQKGASAVLHLNVFLVACLIRLASGQSVSPVVFNLVIVHACGFAIEAFPLGPTARILGTVLVTIGGDLTVGMEL